MMEDMAVAALYLFNPENVLTRAVSYHVEAWLLSPDDSAAVPWSIYLAVVESHVLPLS